MGVVDLEQVRRNGLPNWQHVWVVVANYAVDDELVAQMDAERKRLEADPDAEPGRVNVPMTPEVFLSFDGPGCVKCGVAWNHEAGYGAPCSVSHEMYLESGAPTMTPKPHRDANPQSSGDELLVAQSRLLVPR